MKIFEVKNHAPSLLPDGFDFRLVWSDEFDGDTLDESKWDYRLCMMGKRHPAWTDQGVRIENGCAVFTIFEENGEIVSSQLQTGYNFMDAPVQQTTFGNDHLQWNIGKLRENKFTHRYGYYECYCKLQQLPGWWSAFWMQSPIIGASLDPKLTGSEVDIMEYFHTDGTIVPHNVFTGGYGLDMQRRMVGGKKVNKDEFQREALDKFPQNFPVPVILRRKDDHIFRDSGPCRQHFFTFRLPSGLKSAEQWTAAATYKGGIKGIQFIDGSILGEIFK